MLLCRLYAFDVHCNSYFPLFLLLYGEDCHGGDGPEMDTHECRAWMLSANHITRSQALMRAPSYAVLQFLLSPLLLWRGFLATLLSNALYAVGLGYYHYLNFLGYSALPFLDHTEVSILPERTVRRDITGSGVTRASGSDVGSLRASSICVHWVGLLQFDR